MKQRRDIKPTDTNVEQETKIILSLDYSFTPVVPEVPNFLEVPLIYRTVRVGPEEGLVSKRSADSKVRYSQIVEIKDPRFEETYTAYVTRMSTGWSGRIPDVPEVNKCEGTTKQVLLASLTDNLYDALKARSDSWDKQIEEDVKAGRLDHLREEILEDIQAARLTDL